MSKPRRATAASLTDRAGAPLRFDYGVILGKDQALLFGSTPDEIVSVAPVVEADFWVIDPDDPGGDLVLVVVDMRSARRDSFLRWVRHAITATPDSPAVARVYVPEKSSAHTIAAPWLQWRFDEEGIAAETIYYDPPQVW